MSGPVLLDTCALLGVVGFQPFASSGVRAIQDAGEGGAYLSEISALEIAQACRFKHDPKLDPIRRDARGWFVRLLQRPTFSLALFSIDVAVEAYALPDPLHRDPVDRVLIATARLLRMPIVTSDAKIIAYAALGHVDAVAC